MKNTVKAVLLLIIIFLISFYGCSNNSNPLEKVKSLFTSSAEQSGPSDTEVLNDIVLCHGADECECHVVQRDKQMEEGSYPVHVRMSCTDGTKGDQIYNCKKVQNENGNDVWNCPQVSN
jgi:hypothetical protein